MRQWEYYFNKFVASRGTEIELQNNQTPEPSLNHENAAKAPERCFGREGNDY